MKLKLCGEERNEEEENVDAQCNFSNSFHNNIHLKLLENCESEFTLMVVNEFKN